MAVDVGGVLDPSASQRVIEEHSGTPPHPGLVFNEQSHHWERPEGGAQGEKPAGAQAAPALTGAADASKPLDYDHAKYAGAGTKASPVHCHDNIELAAQLLARDQHVRLEQPDQVATLIDRLGALIDEARAGGKEAHIDLCKVTVPGTNLFCQHTLGIPRVQMPQMAGIPVEGTFASTFPRNKKGKVNIAAEFVRHLRRHGVKVKEKEVRASHLRASQNQLIGEKIIDYIRESEAGTKDLRKKPIFVTKDGYVIDGHHHWAALVGLGYKKDKDLKIPVYQLDMEIGEALRMANEFAQKAGLGKEGVPAAKKQEAHDLEAEALIDLALKFLEEELA